MLDIKEGVKLFNDGSYFEAHDYFEEMWNCAVSNEREFYQGLVQISVGLFHLISKNYNGALSQFSKGAKKLKEFPNNFKNINVLQFRYDINYLIKQITLFFSKKNHTFEVIKIYFIY